MKKIAAFLLCILLWPLPCNAVLTTYYAEGAITHINTFDLNDPGSGGNNHAHTTAFQAFLNRTLRVEFSSRTIRH